MIVARGNARWMSPAQMKLNGILSVTRAAFGAIARSTPGYSAAAWPGNGASVPAWCHAAPRSFQKIQLAAGADLGMAGDDLLDEGRAGPRHADDQHRRGIAAAQLRRPRDQFGRAA